ncbi:hypothetical protein Focb16_v003591 [Fusarium oxysporum f. sp. cubense]|uniref:Uncharacterized protein n=1 Tax=Fusarium oxysporum f. sp. cubense TaxID=61366 RepID=A0A559KME2_FUSOC|nr:hypothetical protein Focb16_v003591 [Fusarium oxysporum f. sp. cubense]
MQRLSLPVGALGSLVKATSEQPVIELGERLVFEDSAPFSLLPQMLRPLFDLSKMSKVVRPFTKNVTNGQSDVGEFKEVMGKKWRRREGNEKSDDGNDMETQDSEIERFIWA